MPNNKKAQRNGFYYYMQDMMPQLRKAGHHFPNGMQDVVPIAHPTWKALSQSERDAYDKRAQEAKAKVRGSEGDKFRMDNTRTLISHRRDPNEEMRLVIKEQRRYRSVFLNWRPGPYMLHERFYFIDFTSMCKLEDTEYWIPLEMSLVEYTMKEGIQRTLHKFINPGNIPLGYRYECQNKSEIFHRIPIEGFNLASSDYLNLWHSLENFLTPSEESKDLPPMYTLENKLEETNGCILWLLHHSCVGSARGARLRVHHMESMVQDLFRNAEQEYPPAEASIFDMMTQTQFDYQKGVVCSYHEELDCKQCSLGRVKVYCFAISDAMAPLYNFVLTSKHLPKMSGDIGLMIEPKPVALERSLRQQVQPAFRGRGGARGRGYMTSREQQANDGAAFGGRDYRVQRDDRFVPDREKFDDEFSASAPPLTQLRQPSNPGIAAQLPAQNTNTNAWSGATGGGGGSVIHGHIYKDDPAYSGIKEALRREESGPSESPWKKPEVKKSFDEDFPTLGEAPVKSVGRGMMPPREISLGRGTYTPWGMTQSSASTGTAFAGAGRGRGGWTPGPDTAKTVVAPPPGLLR